MNPDWRAFQARQKVMELGDRFLSYLDEGSGDPVVLIHGIPTWGFLWHGLVDRLAKTHRVLVPDLMGYGFSDKSDRFDRSIAPQAEWIDGWLEKLGLSSASVVAHDIGGGVALRLATLFPRRVSRLAVMNCVCYDSWPVTPMNRLGDPANNHSYSASSLLKRLRASERSDAFATTPPQEVLDGLFAPYTTEVGKESLVRNASGLNTSQTMEIIAKLPEVSVPTLILWGEDDTHQKLEYGERLAGDIPDARLIRIGDARHFVMIDQPEAVLSHLEPFLSGASA